MECKNCLHRLEDEQNFCSHCGAKVIRKRLTLQNIATDFSTQFLSVDNTFMRTLIDLTVRPGEVLRGYIAGVRKKYLGPFNYLGLSLACSGILFFLITKYYLDRMQMDIFDSSLSPETGQKILSLTADYSSFIFILYVPVMAIAGYLTFNKADYLLPEHAVISIYSLAQYNIASFPISLFLLILSPESYFSYSLLFIALMIGYSLFVLNSLCSIRFLQRIQRSAIYILLFLFGYMAVAIGMNIFFFLTGDLNLQDFMPKK